jgi:hypothetical protein
MTNVDREDVLGVASGEDECVPSVFPLVLRPSHGRHGDSALAIAPCAGLGECLRRKAVTALLPRQVTAMDEQQACREDSCSPGERSNTRHGFDTRATQDDER